MNRVLLFEENPINSKLIKRLLEQIGYEVECVETADVILDILQDKKLNNKYLAVFLDVKRLGGKCANLVDAVFNLKDLDNISKGNTNATPILIGLVGGMRDYDVAGYLELGMDNYLPTPISSSSLISLMKLYEDEIDRHYEQFKRHEKSADTLSANGLFDEVTDSDLAEELIDHTLSNNYYDDLGANAFGVNNSNANDIKTNDIKADEANTNEPNSTQANIDVAGEGVGSDIEDTAHGSKVEHININDLMVTDLDSAYTNDVGRYLSRKVNIEGSFNFDAFSHADTVAKLEAEEIRNIYSDLNKNLANEIIGNEQFVEADVPHAIDDNNLNLGKIMTPREASALDQLHEDVEIASETVLDEESFAINSLAHEIEELVNAGYDFNSSDDDLDNVDREPFEEVHTDRDSQEGGVQVSWRFLDTTASEKIVPSTEYKYVEKNSFEELDNAIAKLISEAKLISSKAQSEDPTDSDVGADSGDLVKGGIDYGQIRNIGSLDSGSSLENTLQKDFREDDIDDLIQDQHTVHEYMENVAPDEVNEENFVQNLIQDRWQGQSVDSALAYDGSEYTNDSDDTKAIEDDFNDVNSRLAKREKSKSILESDEVVAIKAIFNDEINKDEDLCIDRVSIEEVGRKLGISDMELMQKIFDKYFVDSATVVLKLMMLKTDEDHDAIGKLVQSIKATSSNLSMLNIAKLAREIELKARYFVDIYELVNSIIELKDMFDKSYRLYNDELK